nr:MAG TPA: hypothetical protein [Caudoviricetes sp.]DAM37458.1 MAG TPA: hypothetical protein [Caudoviricetes sp.]
MRFGLCRFRSHNLLYQTNFHFLIDAIRGYPEERRNI